VLTQPWRDEDRDFEVPRLGSGGRHASHGGDRDRDPRGHPAGSPAAPGPHPRLPLARPASNLSAKSARDVAPVPETKRTSGFVRSTPLRLSFLAAESLSTS